MTDVWFLSESALWLALSLLCQIFRRCFGFWSSFVYQCSLDTEGSVTLGKECFCEAKVRSIYLHLLFCALAQTQQKITNMRVWYRSYDNEEIHWNSYSLTVIPLCTHFWRLPNLQQLVFLGFSLSIQLVAIPFQMHAEYALAKSGLKTHVKLRWKLSFTDKNGVNLLQTCMYLHFT